MALNYALPKLPGLQGSTMPGVASPTITAAPAATAPPVPRPVSLTGAIPGRIAGATPPQPATLNYPTEAQMVPFNTQFYIPGNVANWWSNIYGPYKTYYNAAMGGVEQSQQDWRNLQTLWLQRTGKALDTTTAANLLQSFKGYATAQGRIPTVGDLFNYVNRVTPEQYAYSPPRTAFMRVGEF